MIVEALTQCFSSWVHLHNLFSVFAVLDVLEIAQPPLPPKNNSLLLVNIEGKKYTALIV